VETQVKALAQEARLTTEIVGKRAGYFPKEGELLAGELAKGLAAFFEIDAPPLRDFKAFTAPPLSATPKVPAVADGFCPGCPYDPTFDALRAALEERGEKGVLLVDPGCAVRLMIAPFEMLDVKMSMGSCVGIGAGIARVNPDARVIACPGDSGFYHTAINGLVNAAYNRTRMVVLVLDNLTTALSGCQPSPTTGVTAMGDAVRPILPEDFAAACQIDFVRVVDPFDRPATKQAFLDALAHEDLSLVVMRSPCILI
ncbi:MAG: thiamine pyrophosphate-dependent enzyme, partial [Candidatus Poribacteria bacterium]|nr:thiamine pyrophosphate-dependent enzyme [Candidatus Poribacteria bacterium]